MQSRRVPKRGLGSISNSNREDMLDGKNCREYSIRINGERIGEQVEDAVTTASFSPEKITGTTGMHATLFAAIVV